MGAMLIFDVQREELDRILDADPYYHVAGVEIVRIREWTPIVRPEVLSPADFARLHRALVDGGWPAR